MCFNALRLDETLRSTFLRGFSNEKIEINQNQSNSTPCIKRKHNNFLSYFFQVSFRFKMFQQNDSGGYKSDMRYYYTLPTTEDVCDLF